MGSYEHDRRAAPSRWEAAVLHRHLEHVQQRPWWHWPWRWSVVLYLGILIGAVAWLFGGHELWADGYRLGNECFLSLLLLAPWVRVGWLRDALWKRRLMFFWNEDGLGVVPNAPVVNPKSLRWREVDVVREVVVVISVIAAIVLPTSVQMHFAVQSSGVRRLDTPGLFPGLLMAFVIVVWEILSRMCVRAVFIRILEAAGARRCVMCGTSLQDGVCEKCGTEIRRDR